MYPNLYKMIYFSFCLDNDDKIQDNNVIFIYARTPRQALKYFSTLFPEKYVKTYELTASNCQFVDASLTEVLVVKEIK